jgi:hypothetical protein
MISFFIDFLTCLRALVRSRYNLGLESLALRQQLGIFKRKIPRSSESRVVTGHGGRSEAGGRASCASRRTASSARISADVQIENVASGLLLAQAILQI